MCAAGMKFLFLLMFTVKRNVEMQSNLPWRAGFGRFRGFNKLKQAALRVIVRLRSRSGASKPMSRPVCCLRTSTTWLGSSS